MTKFSKMPLAIMALAAVGLFMLAASGPAWAKKADTGATIQQQQDKKLTIKPASKARAKPRAIPTDLKVTLPRAGMSARRSGLLRGFPCHWTYKGNATHAPNTDFHVWVIKNSDRSWSIDLGRNHNTYIEALAYQRMWVAPEGLALGTDYFFRVKHIPSGLTTHSPLFSVVD